MASKYIQKYPIPGQFPELLHDFAREVLRDQPDNIYDYGAAYFKALEEGKPFQYQKLGKAIPPPKDRQPSMGSYKEMPTGPKPQNEYEEDASNYVQDLIDRASESASKLDMEEEEEEC